jgi:hypothetical protein
MPSDAERILQTKIDHLVRARKYSTSAAVDGSLNAILALDRLKRINLPHTLPFIIEGLKVRAKAYNADHGAPTNKSVGQQDFARIDNGFARLIYAPVALDEAPGTIRMPPIQMTLDELKRHVALKQKKACEVQSNAELLIRFIEEHPDWKQHPKTTLGQILRRELDERATA